MVVHICKLSMGRPQCTEHGGFGAEAVQPLGEPQGHGETLFEKMKRELGAMAQWLNGFLVVTETLDWVPSTHVAANNHL